MQQRGLARWKDLVRWLLTLRPAAVDAVNAQGRSALHLAAAAAGLDICRILTELSANINPVMQNRAGRLATPLGRVLF